MVVKSDRLPKRAATAELEASCKVEKLRQTFILKQMETLKLKFKDDLKNIIYTVLNRGNKIFSLFKLESKLCSGKRT